MSRKVDWAFFEEGMKFLGAAYEREITPEVLRIFWRVCDGLTKEEFTYAVGEHAETSKWFPKPVELKDLAADFAKMRPEEIKRRQEEADRERDQFWEECRAERADPARRARWLAWVERRRVHYGVGEEGEQIGKGPAKHFGRCGPDCETCRFQKAHPHANLHLKANPSLTVADLEAAGWPPVEGCCAVVHRDIKPENRPPVAAGPAPKRDVGGEVDWLTKHQEEQEERDRRW